MIQTARAGSYRGGNGLLVQETFEGKRFEVKTMTCSHCSTVVLLNPERIRDRARCTRCSRYICDRCSRVDGCNSTNEMIDLAFAYPGQGPFLARGPGKEPLYDTQLRDRRRLW